MPLRSVRIKVCHEESKDLHTENQSRPLALASLSQKSFRFPSMKFINLLYEDLILMLEHT